MTRARIHLGQCLIASLALASCNSGSEAEPATSDESAVEGEMAASTVDAGPPPPPEVTAAGDPIRGPGGLEEKCRDRVNEMVGGQVIGTNRIEEAESGVAIFFNVEDATAPWRCFGNLDGTIEDVMFTGDEGAL